MQNTIDQLVLSYNAGNARAFANLFTLDAQVYEHAGRLSQQNREEIFVYYQDLFTRYPLNCTTVLHRIVLGKRIIDHEQVQRSPEHDPFRVVTIYELKGGLIGRIDFLRGE
jgi:hypothetical protein